MGASIKITGLVDLISDFNAMNNAIDNPVLDAALDAGAAILASSIQKRAPKSLKHRGKNKADRGRTIGDRKIKRDSRWRGGLHMADTIKTSKKRGVNENRYCYVGPDEGAMVRDNKTAHFYWMFHEFGTSKMAAKPFMGPGYEASESAVQKIMEETLMKELGL